MYVLKSTISLIGMPGVGKSVLSSILGTKFNIAYIDLDEQIEKISGYSIAQLWNKEGEVVFRNVERQALLNVFCGYPVILSCGGGTPCFFDNMNLINRHSFSIYLKTDHANLTNDINSGRHPVFKKASNPTIKWNELLDQRAFYYQQAQMINNAFNIEPNIAEAVSSFCLDNGLIIKN